MRRSSSNRASTARRPMLDTAQRQTAGPPNWYVASLADGQTHLADPVATGLVAARCDRTPFRPIAALTGTPSDPDQICPSCLTGRHLR